MAKMAYPQFTGSSLCSGSRSTISGVTRSCKRSSFKPSGRRARIGARRAPRAHSHGRFRNGTCRYRLTGSARPSSCPGACSNRSYS